jgi:hypothetical protein
MKNKLKKASKLGILFLGISVLLWSCEQEEAFQNLNSESQQPVFSLKSFEDEFDQEKRELLVSWEEYTATEDTKATYKEYTTTGWEKPHLKTTILKTILKESNKVRFEILRYRALNDTKINRAVSLKNPVAFSGLIHYQNLEGKIEKIDIYQKGSNMNNPSLLNKVSKTASKSNSFYEGWDIRWTSNKGNMPYYLKHYNVTKQSIYFHYFFTSNYQEAQTQWDYLYTSSEPFLRLKLEMLPVGTSGDGTFSEETIDSNRELKDVMPWYNLFTNSLDSHPSPKESISSEKIAKRLINSLGLKKEGELKKQIRSELKNPSKYKFNDLIALHYILREYRFFNGNKKNAFKRRVKKVARKIIKGIINDVEYYQESPLAMYYMTEQMQSKPNKLTRVLNIFKNLKQAIVFPDIDYSDTYSSFVLPRLEKQALTTTFFRAIILESTARIDNELTGKAKCVYGKMVDSKGNINWILENFKDGNKPSEFDLKFVMGTFNNPLTNASTVKNGNTFTIKINKNTLSGRTTLGLVRTIIHEGIHARLREFASRKGSNATTFPSIYEYYREYKNNWDHQQMADYYRSTIAKGLKQFDNGQHSNQFYNDMTWEGLANIVDANGIQNKIYTEAWKKLTLTEKNRIKNTITNEKKNGNKTCK